MNKKILLLYPEFQTTYWSYKHVMPFLGNISIIMDEPFGKGAEIHPCKPI
jgi:hypothetical protein